MKKIILVREDPRPLTRHATVTYMAAHQRVHRAKGKASQYQCVDCTSTAAEWSYNGGSPNELHGYASRRAATPSPYSGDPKDYSPRCRPCHKIHDRSAA